MGAFSTFGFRDGKLAVVELVIRAGDDAAAKRIIGATITPTPEKSANPAFDLRGFGEAVDRQAEYPLLALSFFQTLTLTIGSLSLGYRDGHRASPHVEA